MKSSLVNAARALKSTDPVGQDQALRTLLEHRTAAVGALLEVMEEPGAPVGRLALILGTLGARDAVQPLGRWLSRGTLDVDDRAAVTRALSELVEPSASPDASLERTLLQLTRDPHGPTRRYAIRALAQAGSAEVEPRFKLLADTDPDPEVQKAALEGILALRKRGALLRPSLAPSASGMTSAGAGSAPPTAAPGADVAIEEGGMAIDLEALVAAQPDEDDAEPASFADLVDRANEEGGRFAPHLQALHAITWRERNEAVEALVQAGSEVVPWLLQKLNQPHTGARMGAAMALGRIGAPAAVSGLLMAATTSPASDEDRELRPLALKALANCLTGAEEGLASSLLPLSRDGDRWVRAAAFLCLGRIADRVGVKAATVALTDEDAQVREAAAIAVSEGVREEDEDLVLPFLAILQKFPGPSAEVREAILVALSRIRTEAPAVQLRLRHQVARSVLGSTASMRRMAITALESYYQPDDPPPVGVLDDVLSRLADEHPEVRLVAASFVARLIEPGMNGAAEKLERAAKEGPAAVGTLCLEALRRHDTRAAKGALERIAAWTSSDLSAEASRLLEGFDPQTEEWSFVLPEPSPEVEEEEARSDESSSEEAWSEDSWSEETVSREESWESVGEQEVATGALPDAESESSAPWGSASGLPPEGGELGGAGTTEEADANARRVRAVRSSGQGAALDDGVVQARPASPVFKDDPRQELKTRLRRVVEAAEQARMSPSQLQSARREVLLHFAADASAPPRWRSPRRDLKVRLQALEEAKKDGQLSPQEFAEERAHLLEQF